MKERWVVSVYRARESEKIIFKASSWREKTCVGPLKVVEQPGTEWMKSTCGSDLFISSSRLRHHRSLIQQVTLVANDDDGRLLQWDLMTT